MNQDVWEMLVKPSYWSEFFSGNITNWIMFNGRKEIGKLDNLNWKLTFGEAVQRIWLRRNSFILRNTNCDTGNLFWGIITAVKEFDDSIKALSFSNTICREIAVSWSPPTVGWIKCNIDRANLENGSSAGCGAVVRDPNLNWISGFTMSIGLLDALSAEVWGITAGLEFTWSRGYRRVCISSDSKTAIGLIKGNTRDDHPLWPWIQQIHTMAKRD